MHFSGVKQSSEDIVHLTGNDRSQWRTNVPHFGKVRYTDVYPGIDLVYYGKGRSSGVRLRRCPGRKSWPYSFPDGWRSKYEAESGRRSRAHVKQWRNAPQEAGHLSRRAEGRTQVAGGYTIRGNQVSFKLGEYDRMRPLVIDPVLSWSGYIGGTSADTGTSVAVDSQGNAYITGQTQSLTGFPTTNGFRTSHGGSPAV